ncbi:MAG TPA: hypothetical protein DD435_17140 [Cyanobacteria bacterium UBA8530]|nr:hypothetical protein [Cyanobacteria bacterium UBA8530]
MGFEKEEIMKKKISITLALLMALAMTLTGCGSSTPLTTTGISTKSASSDLSGNEAMAIRAINANPDLEGIDFEEADLAFDGNLDAYAVAGLSDIWKLKTRIGMVRSTSDGEFYLATHEGFIFKKDVDLPLFTDEAKTLKLSKYLNKKALVRGELSGGKMTVSLIMWVPDLSVITDLLSKGRIAGKAYNDVTKAAVADSDVKLTSIETKKIYRARSDKSGKYHFSRLAAGNYALEASKAGYARFQVASISVKARKKSEQHIALAAPAAIIPPTL